MSRLRLGAVTVGQSPRSDITPDLRPLLPGVDLLERGALDDLDGAELQALRDSAAGPVLATRLRNGDEIVVGERHVVPRVQAALDDLAGRGVAAVLLLCTGTFPSLRCDAPLLFPDRVLQGMVRATFPGGTLGVLTPAAAQCPDQRERWGRVVSSEVRVEAVTPYRSDPLPDLRLAARTLRRSGAAMLVLDCLGYSVTMRDAVRDEFGGPVLLARTVLARVAAEFVGV